MTTFAALGDSITLGIGDPVRLPPPPPDWPAGPGGPGGQDRPGRKGPRGWRGWAVLLADSYMLAVKKITSIEISLRAK